MISKRGRRLKAALVSGGLLAGVMVISAPGPAEGVAGPTPAGLSAFVNGTELHAHAVAAPDPKLADVDEAFAISAVNSAGLTTRLVNEVNEAILPQTGKNAYARGGGADVGVGAESPTDANGRPISLSIAESKSPTANPPYTDGLAVAPPTDNGNVQTIDLDGALDPVANASALGGRSATLWNPNYLFPTLGNPLTYGFGTAADAQLINQGALDSLGRFLDPILSTDAPPAAAPDRNVANAQTYTYLVNNGDGTCGIGAEIHQTIAPVNLNVLGTTIEVAGDWVMRGVATGKPTGNKLTYGPTSVEGGTAVIRVLNDSDGTLLGGLNLQDILGDTGLADALDPLDPLADVSVGADARAISPPNADGTATVPNEASQPTISPTHVSAAADVVRLKLLSAAAPLDLGDIRVGHFEMDLKVPDGGVNCEIPVAKVTDHPIASTGDDLTFDIKIPSDPNAVKPFPCDLTNITVTDTLSVDHADNPSDPPKMNIISAKGPHGEIGVVDQPGQQKVTFANIGNWKPGDPPLVIHIIAKVPTNSGTGTMKDTADVNATAANCKASNSVLGDVIGFITGNGSVTGLANFFGANGVGLTGNIRGGGPVSIKGTGFLGAQKIQKAAVLSVTGRNDGLYLALALGLMASAFGLVRLRRRLTITP
jgi:hypothetical protein